MIAANQLFFDTISRLRINDAAIDLTATIDYAVFFDNVIAKEENPLNIPTLDGSNVFTSPSIIAIANLHTCDNEEYRKWEGGTNGEWKFINIPFKGQKEGVDYRTLIDPERLKKQEYSLAIVCCSSYYGDFFEGAIDSELTIDDFTIHYEDVPVQP